MMVRAPLLCLVLALGGTAALAKDLPRAFKDRQSTGCEAFGPGYVKVAGSDTCVRVSGSVRVEVGVGSGGGRHRTGGELPLGTPTRTATVVAPRSPDRIGLHETRRCDDVQAAADRATRPSRDFMSVPR